LSWDIKLYFPFFVCFWRRCI